MQTKKPLPMYLPTDSKRSRMEKKKSVNALNPWGIRMAWFMGSKRERLFRGILTDAPRNREFWAIDVERRERRST